MTALRKSRDTGRNLGLQGGDKKCSLIRQVQKFRIFSEGARMISEAVRAIADLARRIIEAADKPAEEKRLNALADARESIKKALRRFEEILRGRK